MNKKITAKDFKLVMKLCEIGGFNLDNALFVWGVLCAVSEGLTIEQFESIYGKKTTKTEK